MVECDICHKETKGTDGFWTYPGEWWQMQSRFVCNRCQERAEIAQDECIERQIDDLIAKEHEE